MLIITEKLNSPDKCSPEPGSGPECRSSAVPAGGRQQEDTEPGPGPVPGLGPGPGSVIGNQDPP